MNFCAIVDGYKHELTAFNGYKHGMDIHSSIHSSIITKTYKNPEISGFFN